VISPKEQNLKHAFSLDHPLNPIQSPTQYLTNNSNQHYHRQDEEEATVVDIPEKIESIAADATETYSTLASPSKYFFFLAFFVVCPVGAWVFFYGGGKEKVRKWKAGKGYEKMDLGKA
jgi:hypothetical protein